MAKGISTYDWTIEKTIKNLKLRHSNKAEYLAFQFRQWKKDHKKYKISATTLFNKIATEPENHFAEIFKAHGFAPKWLANPSDRIYTYKNIISFSVTIATKEYIDTANHFSGKSDKDEKLLANSDKNDVFFSFRCMDIGYWGEVFAPMCKPELIPEFFSEFLPFAKAVADEYDEHIRIDEEKQNKLDSIASIATSVVLKSVFEKLNIKARIYDTFEKQYRATAVIPSPRPKNLDMYVNRLSAEQVKSFSEVLEKLIKISIALEEVCISYAQIRPQNTLRYRYNIIADCKEGVSPRTLLAEHDEMITDFINSIQNTSIASFKTIFK